MKKRLLFGAFISLISTSIFAQNVVWYFGAADTRQTSYGLDFTSGSPVQRNLESELDYYESVTVVSDNSGKVLYYSDGIQVYDGTHQKMVGAPDPLQGTQDGPSGSSVQGAFSLLKPGSQTEYYLFTSQAIDGAPTGFRVNRIDMTLPGNGTVANPAGEMVTADSVLLGTGTEMMTAYGNCGSDSVWIITHSPNSWDFVTVLVTANGIQSVSTQNVPTPRSFGAGFAGALGRGSMDISSDGSMLVMTGQNPIGTHLLDFNKHTGAITNHRELRAPNGFPYDGYGCEFSPDGTKIYFTSNLAAGMWQYDINTGLSHDIPNSAITHGEIITGIDDKLYVGKVSQNFSMTVGVIDNPNAIGAAANYDKDAITFPNTAQSAISYAMPQGFYCPLNPCEIDAVGDQCDTTTTAFQLTAEPSGGTWGGGAYITAGGMFNPSAAGVGSHWVTYDAGCDKPDSIEITVNNCCPNIDPNLGPDVSICDDLTQLLDAGAGMTTYRWYENGTLLVPQTGSTLTADSGTYVVEVVDGDGCTGADTIELGNFQLPQPDLGPDDSFCSGKDITLDAGAGYASYSWSSGGGSGQTATYNAANTYTVTVVDGNGCEGSDDIVITIDDLPTPTISGPSIVCENSSVDLTATIGGSSSLNWTGFGNSNPLNVTSAGTYTVVETDANGCVDSVSQVVTLENAPSVEIGGPYSICDGQQTETLDATTGVGTDTYLWSDNSTDPTLEVSSAGEYSVIVTSATGCKAYDTADVSIFTPPTVSLGNDTFFCAGASVTLDAGAGFTTYDWSSGGSSQTENINGVGTISVTVTDANGCTGTDEVEISENELPTVDLGGDLGVCGGDSVVLDATHPDAASYLWTPNNENTATIKVPSDDETYGVTITDVDGCTFTTTKNITQDAPPSVEIGGPYTVCHSQETQTLDASTGASGETYLWSTGETSSSIEFGDSSMVWVRVTTALGCEAYDTAYVDTFSLPTVSLGNDTFFCAGASVTLDAGAGFVSYDWSSGGSSQTESISGAATVTVTVTDANGCTATDDNEITENALPEVDLGAAIAVCEYDSIVLDATHPDAASYLWTPNNENTATIKVPSDDETYSVTITDVDGCEFTATREISSENPPSVNIGGDDIICDDLTKTLDAGSAPGATYEWYLDGNLLSSETGQTLDADSGIYVVVVTSSTGCEGRDTAYIDNHQLPEVGLNDGYEFCAGDSVELVASAGLVDYSWTTGESSQNIWVKSGGTYSVNVTDGNACENSQSVEVTENALPNVNIGDQDSACVGLEIELDATVSNGVSYVWSNGHNQAEYTLVGPDTLWVEVTDDNNCVNRDTIEVKALDPLDLSSLPEENKVCAGQESENPLDAGNYQGGVYEWTLPNGNVEFGQTIVPLLNGYYKVNITDQFNCKGLDSILNTIVPLPEIDLGEDTAFCSTGKENLLVKMEVISGGDGKIEWMEYNNHSNDSFFNATKAPIEVIGYFTDNETGCMVEDTINLDEFCEETKFEFPTVTVPGGTTNTTFKPIDLPDDQITTVMNNILWMEFEIFNRWGLKVYQCKDVLPHWDGMYENRPVSSGVYYWVLRYQDSSKKIHHDNGFMQIIQMR